MEETRESRVEPGVAVNERYVYSATCSKILLLSYRKARWMENKLQGRVCVPVRSTEWNVGWGKGKRDGKGGGKGGENRLAAHWDSITSEEDQNFVSCSGHGFRFSMNLV